MRNVRSLAIAAALLAATPLLGSCAVYEALTGPAPNQAAALDTGFRSFTALADLGVVFAKSGKETPAVASYVDTARSAVWQNLTAAKGANDNNNSALAASLIDAANQGMNALTKYLVDQGVKAGPMSQLSTGAAKVAATGGWYVRASAANVKFGQLESGLK